MEKKFHRIIIKPEFRNWNDVKYAVDVGYKSIIHSLINFIFIIEFFKLINWIKK